MLFPIAIRVTAPSHRDGVLRSNYSEIFLYMYGSHNDTRVTSMCIVNTQVSAVSLLFTDDVFVAKPLEQRFLWHQRWYVMNELFGATAVLKGDSADADADATSSAAAAADSEGSRADDNSDEPLTPPPDDASSTSSLDSDGTACVVCLSAPRTVAVLPCRHMSLCAGKFPYSSETKKNGKNKNKNLTFIFS